MHKVMLIIHIIEALLAMFAIMLSVLVKSRRRKKLMTRKAALTIYGLCFFLITAPFTLEWIITELVMFIRRF